LLRDLGRTAEAEQCLRPFDDPVRWSDRPERRFEMAAVAAARARMATAFDSELLVMQQVKAGIRSSSSMAESLTALDVVLPGLEQLLADSTAESESSWSISIPTERALRDGAYEQIRAYSERLNPAGRFGQVDPKKHRALRQRVEHGELLQARDWGNDEPSAVQAVLQASWLRWWILTYSGLLDVAAELAAKARPNRLETAILGAYALFTDLQSMSLSVTDRSALIRLDDIVELAKKRSLSAEDERAINPVLLEYDRSQRSTYRLRMDQRVATVRFLLGAPDALELVVDRFAGAQHANA